MIRTKRGNLRYSHIPLMKPGSGVLELHLNSYGFGQDVILDLTGNVTMGAFSRIAHRVIIHTHIHRAFGRRQLDWMDGDVERTSLHISDGVFVGEAATILPQVSLIGTGAVVGAAAVLTKNVPDWEIWAGNPAKRIGQRQ